MLYTLVFVLLLSPLTLHMPDAADLKPDEYQATLDLRPRSMLVLNYAEWPEDKGAAEQYVALALALGHTDLYVRFHASPNPVAYARRAGGPDAWGRLCAERMATYYGSSGLQLHAILANEIDAPNEGGLGAREASAWYASAMRAYASVRPQDTLHVPATSGSPHTLDTYLTQYRADGLVQPGWWIDGHAYGGALSAVVDVMERQYPDNAHMVSELNMMPMSDAARMVTDGRLSGAVWFTLLWANGGAGRVKVSEQDARERLSLLRWRDKYDEFLLTIPGE